MFGLHAHRQVKQQAAPHVFLPKDSSLLLSRDYINQPRLSVIFSRNDRCCLKPHITVTWWSSRLKKIAAVSQASAASPVYVCTTCRTNTFTLSGSVKPVVLSGNI